MKGADLSARCRLYAFLDEIHRVYPESLFQEQGCAVNLVELWRQVGWAAAS